MSPSLNAMFTYHPVARNENTFIFGKARFTFLTPRFVRLEWSGNGTFEDRATLAVVNRRLGKVPFTASVSGKKLTLTSSGIEIHYTDNGKPFSPGTLSARFKVGATHRVWKYGQKDTGNLHGTLRTLDGVNGDIKHEWKADKDGVWRPLPAGKVKLGQGLISRDGWTVVDDSANILLDETIARGRQWVKARENTKAVDLYLLAYGHDYKQALKDASGVFGHQPLVPRYSLGYWFSRYWAYTDFEIEKLIHDFNTMNLPLDVMVIDMDWHLLGWTGYTWDRDYFVDPVEFLSWLKKQGLKITLNLHPAQGVGPHEEQFAAMRKELGLPPGKEAIPFDCTDPKYINAYFKHLHHPDEKRGVDFWWMDWQQGSETKIPGLDPLPWLNHLHWDDQERHQKAKRPLCFSRFGGIGSGRYPVGFSGDTYSNWQSLAFQPYFTATASNVLYGYWSHDIGGHMPGVIEPELFTRWIQFGIYSPILRTHTTKNKDAERRLWQYPDPYNRLMMDAVRKRYEMIPYLYTEYRKAVEHGLSVLRPMYYENPENEEAYTFKHQYYFGDRQIVAPVTKPVNQKLDETAELKFWLPEGRWYDTALGLTLKGDKVYQHRYMIDEIPVFEKSGSILPGQGVETRLQGGSSGHLILSVSPGASGAYDLYEDDGLSRDYLNGQSVRLPLRQKTRGTRQTILIGKATGDYRGFQSRRSVEIRLNGVTPPKSVSFAGRKLPWTHRPGKQGWSYDGRAARVIVTVASVDLRKTNRFTVEYDANLPFSMVDGLKGLLARLEKARLYNCMNSFVYSISKDERFAAKVAQFGNRVSRWPTRFGEEYAAFRKDLRKLPKALSNFRKAILKSKGDDRQAKADLMRKAEAIVASAMAQYK